VKGVLKMKRYLATTVTFVLFACLDMPAQGWTGAEPTAAAVLTQQSSTTSTEEKTQKEQEAWQETQRRQEVDAKRQENTTGSHNASPSAPSLKPPQTAESPRPHDDDKRKREEIRLEVEKRRLVELEKRWRDRWTRLRPITWSDCYLSQPAGYEYIPLLVTVIDTTSRASEEVDRSNTIEMPVSSYEYHDKAKRATGRSYVGVVLAPGTSNRKTSFGVQYLANTGYGVGLWFSGSFGSDSDVIPGTIPHEDYYTVTRWNSYGIQALCGVGSEAATFIFGIGASVEKTTYIDISNVTGWKWYGGETTTVKPCAIAGCRLSLGDRVSLQLGYDTARHAFFGLSAAF